MARSLLYYCTILLLLLVYRGVATDSKVIVNGPSGYNSLQYYLCQSGATLQPGTLLILSHTVTHM